MTLDTAPFALFIWGPQSHIFDLADQLGFEGDMVADAVSIFEDAEDSFHLQALYRMESAARDALSALTIPAACEAFVTQLPDEDWVRKSQEGLPPVFAGRFCVYGAHSLSEIPQETPFPILIEAGPAFGTGHHGTTKGCLLLFDALILDKPVPSKILDLGCGAGTLAIAAAMALNIPVLATDIDPDAIEVTRVNARENNVDRLIDSHCVNGFDDPVFSECEFDLIFANILAGPLMGLAPDITRHLAPGGQVILSGILDEQSDQVASVFEAQGIAIKKGPPLSGWTSLLGKKRCA